MNKHIKNIIIILLVVSVFLLFLKGGCLNYRNLYVWLIFIAIACIRLPVFKIFKEKSKIDYIFVVICLFLLIIPTIKIDKRLISLQENRTLSKWVPIISKTHKINYKFGQNYENWLKDRFWGRNILINFYSNLIYRTSIFVYKFNDFYMNKKNNYIATLNGGSLFIQREKIETIGENLKRFKDYLKYKNIKFYVVIIPQRVNFYKDKSILYKNKNIANIAEDEDSFNINYLESYFRDKYGINYVFLYKPLANKRKNGYIYYKTDHHLTDFGYFIAYQYLLSEMKKDIPDLKINSESDFKLSKNKLVRHNIKRTYIKGTEHSLIGVKDQKILDTDYIYYDYKNLDNIKIKNIDSRIQIHENPLGKYKVFLIGDSFIDGFIYFLDTSFKLVYGYKKKGSFPITTVYKTIDKINPDIVIFLRHSGGLGDIMNFYPRENIKGDK